jgi:hypothetical protein
LLAGGRTSDVLHRRSLTGRIQGAKCFGLHFSCGYRRCRVKSGRTCSHDPVVAGAFLPTNTFINSFRSGLVLAYGNCPDFPRTQGGPTQACAKGPPAVQRIRSRYHRQLIERRQCPVIRLGLALRSGLWMRAADASLYAVAERDPVGRYGPRIFTENPGPIRHRSH